MTPEQIKQLLGGYATNALSADERKTLFEAALEDQELFNALQDEDALRELLADPVARDQVRKVLAHSTASKRDFWSRRWLLGVAIPAAVAVIAIVVMNRANAPRLIAPPVQIASSAKRAAPPEPAAPEPAVPEPATPQTKPQAKASVKAKTFDRIARAAPAPIPQLAAPPAAARLESARPAMASLRLAERPPMPDAVRQQFSAGFAANAPLYQGPLVRYAVMRGGPAGDDIRIQVTPGIAGYLALYQVDAAGNSKRVYPTGDLAAPVLPALTIQIPSSPIKMADASERLRLVVVPQTAAPTAAAGTVGGFVNGAVNKDAAPITTAPMPLVVDIPLAPN